MTLSEWQVGEVVRYVGLSCDRTGPVFEDMVDHICCMVETFMDENALFDDALAKAAGQLPPQEIVQVEELTLKLLDMDKKHSFWSAFRWWYVLVPLVLMVAAIFLTRNMALRYSADASVQVTPLHPNDNLKVENVMAVARSRTVLDDVSLRLYARSMINGDTQRDNNYITARHYRQLLEITPADVQALIDKGSEDATIQKLEAYQKPDPKNFVYGLANWHHPHYSVGALQGVETRNAPGSDMVYLQYVSDDPGIAYNTLLILQAELVKYYTTPWLGDSTIMRSPVKVLDPPVFPVTSLPRPRKAIVNGVLAAGIALAMLLWYVRWRRSLSR